MSEVIYLKALTNPSVAPCLALVDLQQEYIAPRRLMSLPDANAALTNCRKALDHARAHGFPVAHFRQVSRSPFFNPATKFSSWIDGFEPAGAEMIFERDKPSCYSSKLFCQLMDSCGWNFVLAGFAGETACLSTAIDAYHRNHRLTFLENASASHRLDHLEAGQVQDAVAQIIRVYGEVLDTDTWIDRTSATAFMDAEHVS